jgi:coenzyme Q-binding protein COQ10
MISNGFAPLAQQHCHPEPSQMREFESTRRVAHSAKDMFSLVADVERYPEFLPLCRDLVLQSRETVDGKEILTADMTVAYKLVNERFSSRVTLDCGGPRILVEYLNGPFKHLENRWEFKPARENACDVHFYIAYEFRSAALQLLMGGMFEQAFRHFAKAFETRADQIYGTSGSSTPASLTSP